MLVCGRDDTILFASRTMLQYFPVPSEMLLPGTRLRDFLGAVYDTGVRPGTVPENSRRRTNREDWIAEHMALHWRERYENVERAGRTRWVSMRKRRLSSGIGILSITDVSDQKKRDEQLQTDLERVELTEEILDAQPNPICVKDRNLNYIAVNKAFCLIHDLSQDAILGVRPGIWLKATLPNGSSSPIGTCLKPASRIPKRSISCAPMAAISGFSPASIASACPAAISS